MERAEFLGRLRARGGGGALGSLSHPLPGPVRAGEALPVPGYPRPGDHDSVAQLRTVAAAKGWNVRTGGTLKDVLAEVVEAHGARRAVCSADPEVAGAAEVLGGLGVVVLPFDGPATAARADLGLTGAAFAIAATGSVVLSSGRAGGRAASLAPPVHVAVVSAANVLAQPADLWRRLPERFPNGLPSQLVLASGPSRSADIEFTLTVGVHGPKAVWLVVR